MVFPHAKWAVQNSDVGPLCCLIKNQPTGTLNEEFLQIISIPWYSHYTNYYIFAAKVTRFDGSISMKSLFFPGEILIPWDPMATAPISAHLPTHPLRGGSAPLIPAAESSLVIYGNIKVEVRVWHSIIEVLLLYYHILPTLYFYITW